MSTPGIGSLHRSPRGQWREHPGTQMPRHRRKRVTPRPVRGARVRPVFGQDLETLDRRAPVVVHSSTTSTGPESTMPVCPECGGAVTAADAFCAQCRQSSHEHDDIRVRVIRFRPAGREPCPLARIRGVGGARRF